MGSADRLSPKGTAIPAWDDTGGNTRKCPAAWEEGKQLNLTTNQPKARLC